MARLRGNCPLSSNRRRPPMLAGDPFPYNAAMTEIVPIGEAEQRQVVAEVAHYVALGATHFGRDFALVPVLFDLKGTTWGMYRVSGQRRQIRFNPWMFAKYYADSLATTVPHEVAHYLTDAVYGLGKIRPHGVEWKAVMAVFGADDSVRSSHSLEGIPRRQMRRFPYLCACRSHQLSSQRHKRIQSGQTRYHCRACGNLLRPLP